MDPTHGFPSIRSGLVVLVSAARPTHRRKKRRNWEEEKRRPSDEEHPRKCSRRDPSTLSRHGGVQEPPVAAPRSEGTSSADDPTALNWKTQPIAQVGFYSP